MCEGVGDSGFRSSDRTGSTMREYRRVKNNRALMEIWE